MFLGSSHTRDAAGDYRVFLCDLRGLVVWIKFLTAAGNIYSHSSTCNMINFQTSGERCHDFLGVSVGVTRLSTAGTAGPGCAWLEPELELRVRLCPAVRAGSESEGAPEALGFCAVLEPSSFSQAPYCTQAAPLFG